MKLKRRIEAFNNLGNYLKNLDAPALESLAEQATRENAWFTRSNVEVALKGVQKWLSHEQLTDWVTQYDLPETPGSLKVGVVAAGNIPLVGFHDLLSVLMAGHHLHLKLSASDSFLTKHLLDKLLELEPDFKEAIKVVDRIQNAQAVIATGSDNTARYFDHYFQNIPNIIRKNRTSVAVLDGNETESQLEALADDIFLYFGLGCRNVSKLWIPQDYAFDQLFPRFESYQDLIHHHKYSNNYDYNKAIYLVNQETHLDNGFVLMKPDEGLVSPLAVVFYQEYQDQQEAQNQLEQNQEKIQCVVSSLDWLPDAVEFGQAQYPELTDYADGVDTIKFLSEL